MLEIKAEARDYIAHGVSTCPGCGLELALRVVVRALGKNTVIVNPPGCVAVGGQARDAWRLFIQGVGRQPGTSRSDHGILEKCSSFH